MGKLCKKLVVYLDQNFISEMAKAPSNERVNPQFTAVYELLHRGFLDEKLIVPRSFFHSIETSLAPQLREQIEAYQGYLGQTTLRDRISVQTNQLVRAIQDFRGEASDELDYTIVFDNDPDLPLKTFDLRVHVNYEVFDIRGERQRTAVALEETRQREMQSGTTYQQRVAMEIADHGVHLLGEHPWIADRFTDRAQLQRFCESNEFSSVPSISIAARMWARLLLERDRSIKPSDHTDIEIISAYLPYVDVLATDRFMAALVCSLGLDSETKTRVFASSKQGLLDFEAFLTDFLANGRPANWPDLSIFVVADDRIKKDSIEFFRRIAAEVASCKRAMVEVFGFDDGNMPQYAHPPSGTEWPFYGMQEVREVPLPPSSSRDTVLEICRAKSRAKKFIVIESHDVPPGFLRKLLEALASSRTEACGFTIYEA